MAFVLFYAVKWTGMTVFRLYNAPKRLVAWLLRTVWVSLLAVSSQCFDMSTHSGVARIWCELSTKLPYMTLFVAHKITRHK